MLQQFTWQDFLIAAIVLTLLWYAGVALLYFRGKLGANFFPGRSGRAVAERLPHRWEKGVEDLAGGQVPESGELMGKAKLPEGMEVLGMDEFGFGPSPEDRDGKLGRVPDLLKEIREALEVIATEDGSKQDFLDLMGDIVPRYLSKGDLGDRGPFYAFIREHAPFPISMEELDGLWGEGRA